jgi:hypothetical protein
MNTPCRRCYTSCMRTLMVLVSLCVSSIAVFAESTAGVRWTAPAGWKNEGSQPMRAVTYAIAPASGDTAGAECGVYFFGAGQGGSPEANVERWKGQFHGPDGRPAAAQVAKRMVRGLRITTIDTSGEYSGLAGPTTPQAPVAGYRLLGAIIEAPAGNVFVKFTGPAKTIAANRQKFEQLLASFQQDK